jgi:TolB-like protein/tRNA A-37 threonylcarbamoyl transferase component Bud32
VSRSDAAVLLKLAESIADGSAVDWEAAEASASHDDKPIIRQMKVLSGLAVLHRSLPRESIAGLDASFARRDIAAPAIGSWAHLTLVERLGGGAFGEVYRAWDRNLERHVALKLLRADESDGDLSASRIANEGRLLARVSHPNVITVHGVAVHQERVGLWMELVLGTTLEQQLAANGPFSAREAAAIGIDLCRALAAIHAAGLIHRDVKAQNVMRADGGRIVLMDLGTGRDASRITRQGVPEMAGTPLYLAPEIFVGSPASARTDLYSLGVLLYHLVTGSFPVRAVTVEQLKKKHAGGEFVGLRDARADLPTAFVRVVDRAIAPEPAKRYASAGALEADLVEALGEPAFEREPRAGVRIAKARRNIVWGGTAVFAAVAIVVLAAMGLRWLPLFGAAAPIRSIAVLPLTNLSGDASQEYFADGMTELLIGDLAKINALRVISRTSAMQFKGTRQSLKEIAKALGVDAVLEGSVQRSGDRVRIAADLVQVSPERHVWVEKYERDVGDLLALENEVARTIADAVKVKLTPAEQAGFAMAATAARQVNPAAQEAYLQGRFFWNKRAPDQLRRALEFFQKAEALDPTFALAYSGEADAYSLLQGPLTAEVAFPRAKAAAQRALQLDPALGEAHASLAFVAFSYERDFKQAEQKFQQALQLNPGYATAHHWYGIYLSAMGRFRESEAEFVRAKSLDPLATTIRVSFGDMLYMSRRYDEAIAELRPVHDLDPSAQTVYLFLARVYRQKGLISEAVAEAEQGRRFGPLLNLDAELARLAALSGRREEVLKTLTVLESAPRFSPLEIATVYAALGDVDHEFEFLNRAERQRTPALLWAKVDPELDSARTDQRFSALLRTLGLSQ